MPPSRENVRVDKSICENCGNQIRADRKYCSDCRPKSSSCLTCGTLFTLGLRGKPGSYCQDCKSKRKSIKSIEIARVKRLTANPRLGCKSCGVELKIGRRTRFEYCEICLPIVRQKYEFERRKRLKAEDANFDRKRDLKKKYGMSLEEFEAILKSQGYACGVCWSQIPQGKGLWHVDHDHRTGKIRGLLCHYCNLALGHFKDDERVMEEAIRYLSKWEKLHA